jgi:hypothetical protein
VEAASLPWRPLGELFVSRGLISEAELETALAQQAATGKRLGEILVERGLVSGPELTDALMDQLGTEIAKEEGFGSGLWAEIKRRHKRDRPEGETDAEREDPVTRAILTEAIAEGRQALVEQSDADAMVEEEQETEAEPEPESGDEPTVAELHDPDFERELEDIANDYSSPSAIELRQAPEAAAGLDPEHEPEPALPPVPAVQGDDAGALRAELDAAREDLTHLQEMLADAMTALAALTAEAQGTSYEG